MEPKNNNGTAQQQQTTPIGAVIEGRILALARGGAIQKRTDGLFEMGFKLDRFENDWVNLRDEKSSVVETVRDTTPIKVGVKIRGKAMALKGITAIELVEVAPEKKQFAGPGGGNWRQQMSLEERAEMRRTSALKCAVDYCEKGREVTAVISIAAVFEKFIKEGKTA